MKAMKAGLEPAQSRGGSAIPRIDYHLHTTWTDGAQSVREMHEAALEAGLTHVLYTEHARKTSGDWFGKFAAEVRALPRDRCKALVGIETKVESFDGDLDTTPELLALTDLVMASVHRFPGEKGVVRGFGDVDPKEAPELEFKLALAILENPEVDILGHPFGMCYRRYHVHPPVARMKELIRTAARTGVAFEINTRYHPNPAELLTWCREEGARVSLGSNAHETAEVGRVVRILEGKEAPWNPSESS